jgi:hypothetical protein
MSSFATGGASFLLAVDHSARATIVGKRGAVAPAQAQDPIPEECEGAFSPYVEPSSRTSSVDAYRQMKAPKSFRDGRHPAPRHPCSGSDG